jgi:hypothetical protein
MDIRRSVPRFAKYAIRNANEAVGVIGVPHSSAGLLLIFFRFDLACLLCG